MNARQASVGGVILLAAVLSIVSEELVEAHGTHYSQIHVTSDAWLAVNTGKVGVGITNPGSLLDVEEVGVYTNTQQNPATRSIVQTAATSPWDPGHEYSTWQGQNHATEAGTFAVDVPPTSSVYGANGVASYMRSQAPSADDGGTNVVAGYFQAVSVAEKANIFGINALLVDSPGMSGQRMSNEFDFHVHNDSTDVAGVRLNLAGSAENPNATAFQVAVTPSAPGQWQSAYYSFDGAAWVGVNLGTNAEGDDSPSQEIRFNGRDSTGALRTATIQGAADGALLLRSGQNGKAIAVQDHNGGAGANIAYFNSTDIRFYTYLTFDHLTGTGNAYACLNPSGTLFRSSTPCN